MKSTFQWKRLSELANRNSSLRSSKRVDLAYREVLPSDTDASITNWNEPHLVATPTRQPASGYLVLFLPGSYGNPRRQTSLLQAMVDQGHYAINLRYPNDWTIGGLCRNQSLPDCHEVLRKHILTGQPPNPLLHLPTQDSILNRLTQLLVWLADEGTDHNWAQFLDASSNPRWPQLIVAGHSQGGGHALLISKEFPVARCVLFSAPTDALGRSSQPASWVARHGRTPPEACFGFCHTSDRVFERVSNGWRAMGLEPWGDLTYVEDTPPPYANSHRLVSRARIPRARHHGSVVTDRATPRGLDGQPIFSDVWRYLFTLPKPATVHA